MEGLSIRRATKDLLKKKILDGIKASNLRQLVLDISPVTDLSFDDDIINPLDFASTPSLQHFGIKFLIPLILFLRMPPTLDVPEVAFDGPLGSLIFPLSTLLHNLRRITIRDTLGVYIPATVPKNPLLDRANSLEELTLQTIKWNYPTLRDFLNTPMPSLKYLRLAQIEVPESLLTLLRGTKMDSSPFYLSHFLRMFRFQRWEIYFPRNYFPLSSSSALACHDQDLQMKVKSHPPN